MSELFGEIISSYSRAQAIEDGELVDVTDAVRYALPMIPHVVTTRSVYAELEEASSSAYFEENLLSLVASGWDAALGRMPVDEIRRGEEPGGRIDFQATLNSAYSIHYGPGDDATPVLTIMQTHED